MRKPSQTLLGGGHEKYLLLLAVLCLPPLAILLLPELAHAADEDFVSKLVHEFYNKTSTWEPTLKRYALVVFRGLVILEVCFLGIKAALNRDQLGDILKQFVMLLLMAGFSWPLSPITRNGRGT